MDRKTVGYMRQERSTRYYVHRYPSECIAHTAQLGRKRVVLYIGRGFIKLDDVYEKVHTNT